jgi:serine/threonine protein kinase
LGQGSQGKVRKVRKDNVEYAMKLVDPVIMKDEKLAYQIMQEALLLKSLDHENIIKVIDFFKFKNGKFISIMEY